MRDNRKSFGAIFKMLPLPYFLDRNSKNNQNFKKTSSKVLHWPILSFGVKIGVILFPEKVFFKKVIVKSTHPSWHSESKKIIIS